MFSIIGPLKIFHVVGAPYKVPIQSSDLGRSLTTHLTEYGGEQAKIRCCGTSDGACGPNGTSITLYDLDLIHAPYVSYRLNIQTQYPFDEVVRNNQGQGSAAASDSHLDLSRAPYCYGLYGVKYIDLVSLDGYTLDALPDAYSDVRVHSACLCVVCVKHIDLVSLDGYTLDA